MDELKLDAWRKKFDEEAKKILSSELSSDKNQEQEFYNLSLDESSELKINISDKLPVNLKEQLEQALLNTKPEDSV